MKIIKATNDSNNSGLKKAIMSLLDEDLCIDIVNLAFSEDGFFKEEVFTDSETFFDTIIDEEPKQVALMFFNGKDLDLRGSANPNREYFRLDRKGNVESTDDPGVVYYDDLLDDIVDYIMEHIDNREFPEVVQDILAEYQDKE